MGFEAAPFDVVEASRRVWLERWDPEAASGMAVFTAILRSYQLLNDQVTNVMKSHDLTFARYEVLTWLATDPGVIPDPQLDQQDAADPPGHGDEHHRPA